MNEVIGINELVEKINQWKKVKSFHTKVQEDNILLVLEFDRIDYSKEECEELEDKIYDLVGENLKKFELIDGIVVLSKNS